MKLSSRGCIIAVFAAMLVLVANLPAFADTYFTADIIGAISSGTSNVKTPFTSILTQGDPISGSFVYDANLIPAAGSGFQNVYFSSFPDIAKISAATAFTINLGNAAVTFTLADAIQNSGAIQYNNGQFVGFFFDADFTYAGNPYRFDDQGGSWSIKLLDHIGGSPVPLTSAKVNGHITGLGTPQPFTPVPVPPTVLLLGSGLVGMVGLRRKFKKS